MKRTLNSFFLLLLVFIFTASGVCAENKTASPAETKKSKELRLSLRDLWVEHTVWVRSVLFSNLYNDKDSARAYEQKVIENARAIADSFIPFYGKDAADRFNNLLSAHYTGIKEYMSASFTDDKAAKNSAIEKLNKNADEMATFLNNANPNLPKDDAASLLKAHAGNHAAEIDSASAKEMSKEAEVWIEMKKNVYLLADSVEAGLLKQFPNRF